MNKNAIIHLYFSLGGKTKDAFRVIIGVLFISFIFLPNYETLSGALIKNHFNQEEELNKLPSQIGNKFERNYEVFNMSTTREFYDELIAFFTIEGNEEASVVFPQEFFTEEFYQEISRLIDVEKIIIMKIENGMVEFKLNLQNK